MAGEPDDVDAMVEPVVPGRHRWLTGLLAALPGDRMVDLGCGTGSTPSSLLAGLAGLAWMAASAYARMANLAVEAELELGRRERLGRALLDALTDPTAVLDPQGRIVAVNQARARFATGGLAVAVGQSYPAACGAAADAGYDGPAPAADGARAVPAGEVVLFRCRYQAPGGAGPFEVTVTPLAAGDGAVVARRPPPA
jgi:PAS domain-containing protein